MTGTGLALGASRTATYLAVSLVLGGLLFVALAWRPALRSIAGTERLEDAFAHRARALALVGCGLGAAGTVGLLAIGHRAPGSGFWLAVEMVSWVAVAAFILTRATVVETQEPDLPFGFACGLAALALVLAGEPSSLFVGVVTAVHVVSAATWVGGIAYLVLALPVALGRLEGERRAALLLGSLSRFSPLAFAAVVAIVLSGAVHAAVVLPRFVDLWQTAFGRLVILKVLLVLVLVGLGAVNRNLVIPALGSGPDGGDPRPAAKLARRALAWEAVAMVAVLIATAALVAAAPTSKKSDPYPYDHVDSRRSAP